MHRVIRQLSIVFLLLGPFWAVSVFSEPSSSEPSSAETLEVIVKFGVEPVAAYVPNLDPIDLQRAAIIRASNQFVSKLNSPQTELLAKFQFIPFAAVKVDRSTLDKLLADPMVLSYEPVEEFHTSLSQSVSLINAPTLWSSGVEGLNQVVAVIDTGVESSHPFMAGKIIDEACFVSSSDCPNGQQTQFGVGAADPLGKPHGTHVAGIVAGRSGDRDGVARSAQIMAIQVFQAGGGASSVDIVRALEYVYSKRNDMSIASVNMSLGGSTEYSSSCDNGPYSAIINLLTEAGIAVVIASGNDGFTNGISSPACASSAISVGSTTNPGDQVSGFSNSGGILDILAPGQLIESSVLNGQFQRFQGTSMAAPHVAGAFALLRERFPTLSVGTLLNALKNSGQSIVDTRNSLTRSRIDLDAAVAALGGVNSGGSLQIGPAGGIVASGTAGGPFSSNSIVYTLTNSGSASIQFTVNESVNWLAATPSSGSISPGQSQSVTVSLDTGASLLAIGNYSTSIVFSNQTNGSGSVSRAQSLTIQRAASANDKFENATQLVGGAGTTTGDSTGAAKEASEPAHSGRGGGASVWWYWEAQEDGDLLVNTAGSSFDTLLGTYTGTNVGALTTIAGNDDANGSRQSEVNFSVTGGVRYYIAVDGFQAAEGSINLTWVFTASVSAGDGLELTPETDFLAQGNEGGPFSQASKTYIIINTGANDLSFIASVGHANWLSVAPSSGTLAPGDDIDLIVSLTESANSLAPGSYQATLEVDEETRIIDLVVTGNNSGSNDNFSNALALSALPVQQEASNQDATKESAEPQHAGNAGGGSLWWSWTASSNQAVQVTTAGSNFDTTLGVYTGSSVDTLTLVTDNDDVGSGSFQSEVTLRTEQGVLYYIAVDGYSGARGSLVLALNPAVEIVNDDFEDATVISSAPQELTAVNRGASRQSGEPEHATSGGASIWWRYSVPGPGEVAISTVGSNYDTTLAVYQGGGLGALSQLAANDDSGGDLTSAVNLSLTTAGEIFIAVDGFSGASGDVVLNLDFSPQGAIEPAQVLLVDDDAPSPDSIGFYTETLDALGITYSVWSTGNGDQEPSAAEMAAFDQVIWFTGSQFGGSAGPGAAGEAELDSYLSSGGCLLISSQDYVFDRGVTSFMGSRLGVESATQEVNYTSIAGAGDYAALGTQSISTSFTVFSDYLIPTASSSAAFTHNGQSAAISTARGSGHTAFLGFPLEGFSLSARQSVVQQFVSNCESSGASRLVNISTRGPVRTGDEVMIGGLIISGNQSKDVVIRAIGPSLTAANVPGALADPTLRLFSGPNAIDFNDDWESHSRSSEIPASLRPTNSLESAIIATLQPGAYTAILEGFNGLTGIGLVEIFEVGDTGPIRLANISTRGLVGTGDEVLIGGVIITGTEPKTVLIRAKGPSLAAFGVPGSLDNPTVSLFSGQNMIDTNDDWQSHVRSSEIPADLRPTLDFESAILVTLQPGAYTAIVRGFQESSGVGLVEIFEID